MVILQPLFLKYVCLISFQLHNFIHGILIFNGLVLIFSQIYPSRMKGVVYLWFSVIFADDGNIPYQNLYFMNLSLAHSKYRFYTNYGIVVGITEVIQNLKHLLICYEGNLVINGFCCNRKRIVKIIFINHDSYIGMDYQTLICGCKSLNSFLGVYAV